MIRFLKIFYRESSPGTGGVPRLSLRPFPEWPIPIGGGTPIGGPRQSFLS